MELREHFAKELGGISIGEEVDVPSGKTKVNQELELEIIAEEVRNAIKFMKGGKAAGPDRITMELYKNLPELGILELKDIFNNILKEEKIPKSFKSAILLPIYKKGQRTDPSNYRGIALLNTIGKIFTKIIQERLGGYIEKRKLLSECQAAYRKGRSTIDHTISEAASATFSLTECNWSSVLVAFDHLKL